MKFLLTFLSAQFICILSVTSALPIDIEPQQSLNGIQSYRLRSNGLNILLMPDAQQPIATVMVTYKVGARNEVAGTTGATHILEHMLFKGTERFNPENGLDYSSQMERIGARSNATTYFDRTNYYATLPSESIGLALELEADRMRNLRIRPEELASEMTVVQNEYQRGENNPVRSLIKEIFAAAFVAHPYGHPTIGWPSDIAAITTEKLRLFYDTYYWPENATLTIIGGFNSSEILAQIVEHFGSIPKAPQPIPEVSTREPEQIGPRSVIIERSGQVGVVIVAFKSPAGTHPDWPALSVLEQVLGADKTGRLYRALEDPGKASASFTFAPQLHDPGLFMLAAYLAADSTHQAIENTILEEVRNLQMNPISEDALKRAKAVIQANTLYGRDGPYAIADQINEAIAMGDWSQYVHQADAIQKVSIEDVQRVAKKYLQRKMRTTGWFVPSGGDQNPLSSRAATAANYYRNPAETAAPESPQIIQAQKSQPTHAANFHESMQIGRTQNGIEVIAIDRPIEQVVSFSGSLVAGDRSSPPDAPLLASLTAAMLDQGTQKQDRFQIAETLDRLGAQIQFSADSHHVRFSGRFLRQRSGAVINLLAEQIRQPAFSPAVFKNLKQRKKASIMQAMHHTDYLATAAISQQLYPQTHPNYSSPLPAQLEDLEQQSTEQLQAFHAKHYSPQSLRLVFAGDIDFQQLMAAVELAFGDWQAASPDTSPDPKPLENQAQETRIFIADKSSVSVCSGYQTGLQRTHPDYLPFMLGNYILGGSFHSKLMQTIRKQQGLTYSINSRHTGDLLTTGHWILQASFSPQQLESGLKASDAVVLDWFENGVTEAEVTTAIETLQGSYLVNLGTSHRVANQVLSFLERGFEPDYIDRYPHLLQQITAEQVNQAIQSYFNPSACKRVVVGTFKQAASTASKEEQRISLRIDAPDPSWKLAIQAVYAKDDRLIVLAQLQQDTDGIFPQVITAVHDKVAIPPTKHSKTDYYILGKTWEWGERPHQFAIESIAEMDALLQDAQELFKR